MAMPTISLKTVYQTVYALAELGEVQILDLGTGSYRVELTVERSHHHLVCTRRGQVRDLFVDVPGLDLSTAQREGFRIAMKVKSHEPAERSAREEKDRRVLQEGRV